MRGHYPDASPVSLGVRKEIGSLTGIRGVAAFMVVLYHYFQDSDGLGPAHRFVAHGYIAVDLFFVLSGFVMALTYGATFSSGFSWPAFVAFLGKRLGRVYPLYLVVTVVVAVLVYRGAIVGRPATAGEALANLLMVQAWGFADSIGGPTWSISTEFAAYLLFPVLVAAVLEGSRFRCWVAACLAMIALVALSGLGPTALNQVDSGGAVSRSGPLDIFGAGTPYPLLRCLAGFILGLAAFRLQRESVFRRLFGWRRSGDIVAAAAIVLWGTSGSDVALAPMFALLVMALATGGSWASAVLGSGLAYWLGEVSYSIYLVHRPVENLMRNRLVALLDAHGAPHAYTLAGAVPLAVTLAVAACTFYGIEKPARDLSRQLMRRKRPGGAATSAVRLE
jgi:peptidoglycan/LPS O-acetylase OafA/YrhL